MKHNNHFIPHAMQCNALMTCFVVNYSIYYIQYRSKVSYCSVLHQVCGIFNFTEIIICFTCQNLSKVFLDLVMSLFGCVSSTY